MHEDGDGESEAADDGNFFRIGLLRAHEVQVQDVDDEIANDNAHIPQERRHEVRAGEDAPNAIHPAKIDKDEQASHADAHRRQDDRRQSDLLELLDMKHRSGASDDKPACRQTDEQHEHGDVETP